jgi:ferritin-like metal-binding protein YciE
LANDQDKHQQTIADYLGDMVALESHIEEALDRQLKEVEENAEARAAVQRYHDMVKHNRDHMKQMQEQMGSTGGNPIKKAGSALLGVAAGVIDNIRTEGISKALRDDYTSFNLAAIGYSMLHTTSTSLGNTQVASVCEEHLRNYAGAIQELNHLIPRVVVWELEKDGHSAQGNAAQTTIQMVDRVWKETAPSSSSDVAGFGMTTTMGTASTTTETTPI